jgi:hypothetical protein
MSTVIIWKLCDQDDSYPKWYEFLSWKEHKGIDEVSTWDDSYYTKNIYKAYRVDDEIDLTYILLKWPAYNRGDYHKWSAEKQEIDLAVYSDKDIQWVDTND